MHLIKFRWVRFTPAQLSTTGHILSPQVNVSLTSYLPTMLYCMALPSAPALTSLYSVCRQHAFCVTRQFDSPSLLSCSNWDTTSHCCGDVLPGHGLLCDLPKMIVGLDWNGVGGCWLGMDSSKWSSANTCGTLLGLCDRWNPIAMQTYVKDLPVLPPSGDWVHNSFP